MEEGYNGKKEDELTNYGARQVGKTTLSGVKT